MAPGTRRANRAGYTEHDDFEGLPVRQWRHEWVNVAPPVVEQEQHHHKNDVWGIELIHGMPKDSSLLAPHSQELLRAARSGRLYKRAAPLDDEDGDENAAEKPEKKDDDPAQKGFSIKVWKQIPRNIDGSEISHLAKRRKNIVTIASKTPPDKIHGPTVTRATVRRMDAAGNPYTEEVTLTEGQTVNGEIISTRIEALQAPAPGLQVVPRPVKKRPAPPKRKPKAGPGRGKKKLHHGPPGRPDGTGAVAPGQAITDPTKVEDTGANAANGSTNEATNQDSEMADGDDDDDDDDDGNDDDGDDGDDGDDQDNHDESDLPDTSTLDITREIGDITTDTNMSDAPLDTETPQIEMSDAPPPPTNFVPNPMAVASPALSLAAAGSAKPEGSPLKNILTATSPTDAPSFEKPHLATETSQAAEVDSTIAEPPSTIVGEEPEAATVRDLPLQPTEEAALLPPPPEQVGNIATPKAEDVPDRASDTDEKGKDDIQDGSNLSEKGLVHQDSIMTEDTIKPEDSASVRFPLSESGAPSEVGTGSINGGGEAAGVVEATDANDDFQRAPSPKEAELESRPEPAAPISALLSTPEASADQPSPAVNTSMPPAPSPPRIQSAGASSPGATLPPVASSNEEPTNEPQHEFKAEVGSDVKHEPQPENTPPVAAKGLEATERKEVSPASVEQPTDTTADAVLAQNPSPTEPKLEQQVETDAAAAAAIIDDSPVKPEESVPQVSEEQADLPDATKSPEAKEPLSNEQGTESTGP